MTTTRTLLAALITFLTLTACTWATTVAVEVIGTGEGVLEARAGDDTLRLVTPKKKHWLIRGLAKGDGVSVTYEQDGEKKVLTKVAGEGTVVGTVVKIEKAFITVKTEGGVRHRLMPKWSGGMPKDGGGHDKDVLKQIHAVKKGQQVRLTWNIAEGKRVTSVTPLANDAD